MRGTALGQAMRAEWTKLVSVRSTWWSLAGAAALTVLFVLVDGLSVKASLRAGAPGASLVSAVGTAATAVLFVAQYAAVALAALVSAGEFATGSIRTTLQCVPRRRRMLGGKSLVLLPVLFCVGASLGLLGVALAMPVLEEAARPVTAGEVVRLAAGLGAYLAFTGVLVAGVGTALRSVAGTLTLAFIAVSVVPQVLASSGVSWLVETSRWFPTAAGLDLVAGEGAAHRPAMAPATLAAWAGVGLWVGAASLRRRDA